MEYWSLYDDKLNIVKEVHPSEDPIPEGCYHLSIEVWPFSGQRFFLTKRALQKEHFPGYWECTGGHVLVGESFLEAAQREVKEEIGVDTVPSDFELLSTDVKDRHIVSVYLLSISDEQVFCLNSREIQEGRWFSVQEIESLHLDYSFVPHQFSRYIEHVRMRAIEQYNSKKPKAVQLLIERRVELKRGKRGLPDCGKRKDGLEYSDELKRIQQAFGVYGDRLYTMNTLLPESVNNSLGGGSPLPVEPFPPCVRSIQTVLQSTALSQYPFPAGDIQYRRSVCEYLYHEGFSKKITPENLIFTDSTTQAYHLILELIVHHGDVVLFTAPTYGLFAFEPERVGGTSRFIPLLAENNWLVTPEQLGQTIDNLNEELQSLNINGHTPRVVAFFQQNPHNPIGKVMGSAHKKLICDIARVCREKSVFLIDDLLYRDIGYNADDLALPAAHFDDEYQNTISLLGLSKCYGLAGLRSGVVVADEILVRGIRNLIFQEVDSASHLNAAALVGAFNATSERYDEYNRYFCNLRQRYRFNLNLVIAAVDGISCVEEHCRGDIESFVKSCLHDEIKEERWFRKIENVHFVPGTNPEAGFFCLIDFTALKGKRADGYIIKDDLSLLEYMFHRYRINFLTGSSIGWPNTEQIVARISFSYDPSKLVRVFDYMKEEIDNLN